MKWKGENVNLSNKVRRLDEDQEGNEMQEKSSLAPVMSVNETCSVREIGRKEEEHVSCETDHPAQPVQELEKRTSRRLKRKPRLRSDDFYGC